MPNGRQETNLQRNRKKMKRHLLLLILALTAFFSSQQCHAQEGRRFDGGMMVHTGYLHGNIKALDYDAKGFTFGLGGVLRFHFGKHFRILQKNPQPKPALGLRNALLLWFITSTSHTTRHPQAQAIRCCCQAGRWRGK